MNLNELKNIIESAKNCGSDTMTYLFKIYLPVSEAIAGNNKTVIGYLLSCEAGDRYNLINAIEDGARRLNPWRAHKLLAAVKKDRQRMVEPGNSFYKSVKVY